MLTTDKNKGRAAEGGDGQLGAAAAPQGGHDDAPGPLEGWALSPATKQAAAMLRRVSAEGTEGTEGAAAAAIAPAIAAEGEAAAAAVASTPAELPSTSSGSSSASDEAEGNRDAPAFSALHSVVQKLQAEAFCAQAGPRLTGARRRTRS